MNEYKIKLEKLSGNGTKYEYFPLSVIDEDLLSDILVSFFAENLKNRVNL